MSKLRSPEDYQKTGAYKFWRWLSGANDPYVNNVEMKPQKEFRETEEDIRIRLQDEEALREKIYNPGKNKSLKIFRVLYTVSAIVLCLIIISMLMICASNLPKAGSDQNPTNNEVVERYVSKAIEETGAVNAVTGMILNYRGFDTFGETCVLFIASSCVMILLMVSEEKLKKAPQEYALEPHDDIILQTVARILVPILFIFGIYVIVNGHISPGGGFSGGAIIGSGLILYSGAFGFEKITKFFNEHVYKCIKITALLLYASTMLYYFFTGANGITNIFPLGTPGNIVSAGMIFFINIFVGSEVACTVYSFYALFKRGGL